MMRTGRARSGWWIVAGAVLGAVACGDDAGNGGEDVVTAAEVAEFYGLIPGTCYVYTYGNNNSQTAFVDILERERDFPDRAEVIWRLDNRSDPVIERHLEAQDGGRVFLLRELSGPAGQRYTRTYAGDGGTEPLFAQFRRAAGDTLDFAGSPFQTQDARPSDTRLPDGTQEENPAIEEHRWDIVAEDVDVGLGAPYDPTFEMSYQIRRDTTSTSVWNFAPGVGFVAFQDFEEEDGGTGRAYRLDPTQTCP